MEQPKNTGLQTLQKYFEKWTISQLTVYIASSYYTLKKKIITLILATKSCLVYSWTCTCTNEQKSKTCNNKKIQILWQWNLVHIKLSKLTYNQVFTTILSQKIWLFNLLREKLFPPKTLMSCLQLIQPLFFFIQYHFPQSKTKH